ncbi:hypothetical protein CCZ01_08795 [Helicobacter monodelphidis]|nr:hypothetical protein CCZ01_08795 [Helicobacter sp. 15-1451]
MISSLCNSYFEVCINHLQSKKVNAKKYNDKFKRLMRKNSRRVRIKLESKNKNQKLSNNFRKTQKQLNQIYERSSNIKKL